MVWVPMKALYSRVPPLERGQRPLPSFTEAKSQFERDNLCQLLQIAGGNVSMAAQLAQRNRTEFYRLLRRHQLEPDRFRPNQ